MSEKLRIRRRLEDAASELETAIESIDRAIVSCELAGYDDEAFELAIDRGRLEEKLSALQSHLDEVAS